MYLTDYHTHSLLSPDSSAPLDAMAKAAAEAGLSEFCVTDHYDLVNEQGARNPAYDWTPALRQHNETARRFADRLKLRLGLELGSAIVDPADAAALLDQPELDFVIGSLHNLSLSSGGGDFYFVDYSTPEACHAALDDYFTSMESLAAQPALYDVLGHIIYPLRYMPNPVPLDRYMERIDEILKTAVSAGRGMELNTYRGKTVEDWRPILSLYRARGGEIITVGSDAHVPASMGGGVPEAYALLSSLGFRYVSVYQRRKPSFIKL